MLSSLLFMLLLALLSVDAVDNTTCGYTCTNGLTSRCKYEKCGDFIDDLMIPYSAFYEGTISLALTGNPASCTQQLYTMENYTVAIGVMKVVGDPNLDRTKYDTNPFYLWFKYQENKNISAGFLSSSDYYVTESQWWTLQSIKSGDGFDISGNYTGKLTPYSNVYNYPSDSCWTVNIYNYIASTDVTDPTDYWFWTISGHISPTKVNIVIDQTIFDGMEYHTKFSYVGDATDAGGKLVTSEPNPTTDLALKGVAATANGTTDGGNSTSNGTANGGKKNDASSLRQPATHVFGVGVFAVAFLAAGFFTL